MINFDDFTKMPKKVGYLGKLIVAKGFKKLPKVQIITQSGHTAANTRAIKNDELRRKRFGHLLPTYINVTSTT